MEAETHGDGLSYWRDRLFSELIVYLIPFSLISLVPGFWLAYQQEMWFLIAADTVVIGSLITIAYFPGFSADTRKALFIGSVYLVTIALLGYLGSYGPGLLFMVSLTVFSVLIAKRRYAMYTVIVNALICVFTGLAIYHNWWPDTLLSEYSLHSWIAVSSNAVLLSLLTAVLVPLLFNGLKLTLAQQERLRLQLERKHDELSLSLHQLKEKNDELENFASIASHDLKEPLRMVRSFMQLLNKNYYKELDEKGQSYVNFAVDGAERMTNLVDDLLQYSRVGSDQQNNEQIDLNDLVDQIIRYHESGLGKENATITRAELPVVEGVPVAIRLLFQNLISNGLKYRKQNMKPVLSISGEAVEGGWQISVKDNGIGIEEKYFDQIFQLFRRLHGNEEYEGTGMGLAMCRKIVKHHGGEISVESCPGEGSTFYFSIADRASSTPQLLQL
ncbi:MAG: sensor histidine kinase [Bacteroidota bacterium]